MYFITFPTTSVFPHSNQLLCLQDLKMHGSFTSAFLIRLIGIMFNLCVVTLNDSCQELKIYSKITAGFGFSYEISMSYLALLLVRMSFEYFSFFHGSSVMCNGLTETLRVFENFY